MTRSNLFLCRGKERDSDKLTSSHDNLLTMRQNGHDKNAEKRLLEEHRQMDVGVYHYDKSMPHP